MFGDKFYSRLQKLMPWQQTLFALALTERMYPNYGLYAEVTGQGHAPELREAMDRLWQMLGEKGVRIDYAAEIARWEAQLPEPETETCYGVYPALDVCMGLITTYYSISGRVGDESIDVSKISLGSVISFLEMQEERELSEEELYDAELVALEMEFQAELLKRVAQPRQDDLIAAVRAFATDSGLSNLGIAASA